MSRTNQRSHRIRLILITLGCAAVWPAGTVSAQQEPVALKVLQEYVEPQPRIGRGTGISLIGVVADRNREGATLNVDLLLPPGHQVSPAVPVCIHARSQDARFSFQGEAPAGLPRATAAGRLRLKADVGPKSVAFLRAIQPRQFALLARLGGCTLQSDEREAVPIIIPMDPHPEEGGAITSYRVLLNAPEGRVSLNYGTKGGVMSEQPCQRSSVKEAGAFATECRLPLPAAERIEVEILRHRFNNKPLVDRFELIGPAAPPRG